MSAPQPNPQQRQEQPQTRALIELTPKRLLIISLLIILAVAVYFSVQKGTEAFSEWWSSLDEDVREAILIGLALFAAWTVIFTMYLWNTLEPRLAALLIVPVSGANKDVLFYVLGVYEHAYDKVLDALERAGIEMRFFTFRGLELVFCKSVKLTQPKSGFLELQDIEPFPVEYADPMQLLVSWKEAANLARELRKLKTRLYVLEVFRERYVGELAIRVARLIKKATGMPLEEAQKEVEKIMEEFKLE